MLQWDFRQHWRSLGACPRWEISNPNRYEWSRIGAKTLGLFPDWIRHYLVG